MLKVYVGAGHSDKDPGVTNGAFREEQLAERLRDMIAANLRRLGVPVKTDGPENINLNLNRSIEIALTCDGPKVELHFNGGPAAARGIECLARIEQKPLAINLCAAIARHTRSPLRGNLGWKPENSGQHHRLGFVSEGGGVVLEVEFLSNNEAIKTYMTKEVDVAASLARVLAEHAGLPTGEEPA